MQNIFKLSILKASLTFIILPPVYFFSMLYNGVFVGSISVFVVFLLGLIMLAMYCGGFFDHTFGARHWLDLDRLPPEKLIGHPGIVQFIEPIKRYLAENPHQNVFTTKDFIFMCKDVNYQIPPDREQDHPSLQGWNRSCDITMLVILLIMQGQLVQVYSKLDEHGRPIGEFFDTPKTEDFHCVWTKPT